MWNVQVECHSQSTGPGLNAVAAAGSHRNISTGDGMIWEEVDSETRTISEHSDIDLRATETAYKGILQKAYLCGRATAK
jgi:hypothetical protein